MSCQGFLDTWLRRPPGWPLLVTLAVELVGALFSYIDPHRPPVILS